MGLFVYLTGLQEEWLNKHFISSCFRIERYSREVMNPL